MQPEQFLVRNLITRFQITQNGNNAWDLSNVRDLVLLQLFKSSGKTSSYAFDSLFNGNKSLGNSNVALISTRYSDPASIENGLSY